MIAEAVEEEARVRLGAERVREREAEVAERQQLEARVGETTAEPGERGRLGRPGDDERRPVEELRQRNRCERRAPGGGERGQLRLAPPGRHGERPVGDGRERNADASLVAVEQDEGREQRQRDVATGVDTGDAVEPGARDAQLPGDAGAEVQQAECGRDREHARPRRLALGEDEREQLGHAEGPRSDQEPVPVP